MRKSTLALAVGAALAVSAVALADTTLYGSGRVSVDYTDTNAPEGSGLPDPPSNWDLVNNASRLGVKGSEDLGDGLSAIYTFEFGVNVTEGGNFNSNRQKFVGLKGGFGQVSLGTQYTPYYNVTGITDIFNSIKTFDIDAYLYPDAANREANSVYYATPDFGGFSGEAMIVMSGLNTASNGIDNWNAALKYQNGPLFAGLTYAAFEGFKLDTGEVLDNTHLFGLGLGYQIGDFSLGFTYEDGDASLAYGDAQNYYVSGAYTFGNNVIQAAYGYVDPKDEDSVNNYLLGFQHNFSKLTSVWVEYIGRSDGADVNDTKRQVFGDQSTVSIGMRHDF